MPSNPEAIRIRTHLLVLVKEYHTVKFPPKSFAPEKDLIHHVRRIFERTRS